jgi:hypothetical protein
VRNKANRKKYAIARIADFDRKEIVNRDHSGMSLKKVLIIMWWGDTRLVARS